MGAHRWGPLNKCRVRKEKPGCFSTGQQCGRETGEDHPAAWREVDKLSLRTRVNEARARHRIRFSALCE
jgi:hypothetical protein